MTAPEKTVTIVSYASHNKNKEMITSRGPVWTLSPPAFIRDKDLPLLPGSKLENLNTYLPYGLGL